MSQAKFKVIYADPPWKYNSWRTESATGIRKKARGMATSHYPVMTTQDIAALPIAQMADRDCVLLMWATWPCFEAALTVGKAWGFKYKTCGFLWAKTNPTRGNSLLMANSGWHFGLGSWSRGNTEPCLLFTKGHPRRISKCVAQLLVAPVGKHSAKPHEAYDRIEQLLPGPYVELFARNKRQNWSSWGNEIESDIQLAQYRSNYD